MFAMPKQQISSDRIRQPSGHFSQATMVEALVALHSDYDSLAGQG
jgi:hypothetical protein